ncbi:DVUA0089 family protein [Paracoccus nototheniae]|uniref:DVUA0089 family protein n=1 Tax=Paracoccus nototheniae TaxID=2489002 RepID=A0ABW4DZD2_9RHOB|nr:DVUA0089 family protein [Paracoccus nototheniae]
MSLMSRLVPLPVALLPVALLAAWPLPALSQDSAPPAPEAAAEGPTCSGQPALWLGDGAETSDLSTADGPLSRQMSTTATTSPYAMFRVSAASQALRVEADAPDADPSLRLETPEGDLLAENDDAVGLASRIEQSVGPGDYCVRLIPIGASDMTATVQLSRPEMSPLLSEPASTTITACTPETEGQPLSAEALSDGALDGALPARTQTDGSLRYLRFSLDATTPVTLRAASVGLDPNMVLFDGAGAQIAANDDADGLNARLDFPSGLAAGDYCLGVAPISAGEGLIDVSVEALDRDNFLRSAWRKGELAPPFDGDYPMQTIDLTTTTETVVLQDGSAQWLDFTLERETALVVGAYGGLVGVDAKLALFGENGAVVGQDDDSAGGTDARMGPVVLEPGRYRLALTDLNRPDQPGAPIRPVGLVFERFERVGQDTDAAPAPAPAAPAAP